MWLSVIKAAKSKNKFIGKKFLNIFNAKTVSTWGQLTNAFDVRSSPFISPKRTGLFGVNELYESSGFHVLTERVLNESQKIIDDALFIADEIKCGRMSVVNLIETFDHLSNTICNVADLAEFVRLSHPDEEFRLAACSASLEINSFVEKLNTNVALYNALTSSLATEDASFLDEESRRVAESLVFDFEQSGIHLDEIKRNKFVELQDNVLRLGSQFAAGCSSPSLFPKKFWPSHVEHEFKNDDDYIFIDGLCYDSSNAKLREIVYKAYMYSNPEQLAILDELLQNRHDLASLVGFPSFLTRALRGTMAREPENVHSFLTAITENIGGIVQKDIDMLMNIKESKSSDSFPVMTWDTQYYTGLAKSQVLQNFLERFSVYFSLGTCMEGLSKIFQSIYGIHLEPSEPESGEVWHPSVVKLTVKHEDEGILGYIYCDLMYRKDKVQQDCHFTIRGGCHLLDGSYQLPVVAIVCNFRMSQQQNIVLLNHGMLENLFHEMGHAMHSMLGRTRYQHVTGTRAATDIVEVPSILMEHYARDPAVLSKFSRHFLSGKQLPDEALNGLCQSRCLFESLEVQTQVFYSMVDHIYHAGHPLHKTTTEILKELQTQYGTTPYVEGTSWQQRFSHLNGGYAGRYYSYLWCRAVASLIWNQSFIKDPLSREAGEKYRRLFLQYGGAREPQKLVQNMLGQEISVNNLVQALVSELQSR